MKKKVFIFLIISNVMFAQNELNHEIYFDTDKYEVPEIEQNRLFLFIQKLDSLQVEKISIYGFCDDVGSVDYNLNLSQQRADVIKELFSSRKIDESLISNVDGKGEILLTIVNTKEANIIRGLNRRVEIIVLLKPSKSKEIEENQNEEKNLNNDLKVGDKIVLKNILFKIGYSTILDESKQVLDSLAEILVEKENIYFSIQGHVCCTKNTRDAVDAETKKQNLSLARAKYIYNFLAKKGVSKKRMKYVGMRRKFPLGGDPKFDRRVEIVVTYISNRKID
ncbi:MAG: OmpA family protein [Bacteroidetes bacterium]|nr:MAG: OmpA family protein [Bacteroidota bacterium]